MRAGRAAGWRVLAWLGATAIVAWPLAWNGFPFVYWDTSEYLWRWAGGRPGFDRPIFYAYALAAFRVLPLSLFAAAFAQAFVTAVLLAGCVRLVGMETPRWRTLACAAIVGASPAALHAVTLMPDVATLWLGLALPLVALARTPAAIAAAGLAVTASLLLHNANVPIALAAAPVVLLAASRTGRTPGPAMAVLAVCFAAALVGYCWNGWRAGVGFRPVPAESLFLATRLQETGILGPALRAEAGRVTDPSLRERYLATAAEVERRRRSGGAFLWESDSPLNTEWPRWRDDPIEFAQARAFYGPVVRHGIVDHPGRFVASSVRNAVFIARGSDLMGGFLRHGPGSGVERVLAVYWGWNLDRYRASRQGRGETPARALPAFVEAWRVLTPAGSAVSLALLVGLLGRAMRRPRGATPPAAAMAIAVSALFLCDVLVCAILVPAVSRYGERVIALPFLALVFAGHAWSGGGARPRPGKPAHGGIGPGVVASQG